MTVQEFLRKSYKIIRHSEFDIEFQTVRPFIECVDGFTVSVQASTQHHSIPKDNLMSGCYDAVELGFPNQVEESILKYAFDEEEPLDTFYGNVPIELVDKIIEKHGGMISNKEEEE